MTENEAIEIMKEKKRQSKIILENPTTFYNEESIVGGCETMRKSISASEMAIKALEEIQQYQAIGTVKECREAREKQRGKKVNNRKLLKDFNKTPYSVRGDCPNCGSVGLLSMNTDYCNACGQKLDWSE